MEIHKSPLPRTTGVNWPSLFRFRGRGRNRPLLSLFRLYRFTITDHYDSFLLSPFEEQDQNGDYNKVLCF